MLRILLILSVVALLITSCTREKDCATCPEEYTSDYNIYMMDAERGQYVYVYNTAKQKIVDSVQTGGHWYDNIEVSNDERYLFMSWKTADTYVWDLIGRKELEHFSFGGTLEVSPDGRYLAVQAYHFRLIDIATLEVTLLDSVTVKGGHFDLTGERFIGVVGDSVARVYHLGEEITYEESDFGSQTGTNHPQILPVANSDFFYSILNYGELEPRAIIRSQLSRSSLKYVTHCSSDEAQMCTANDGALLLVADPWTANGFDFVVQGNVYFIDTESGELEKILQPPGQKYYFDQVGGPLNPGEIVVTPDNQLALVGSGSMPTPYFGIISIPDREYIKIDSLGNPGYDFGIPTSIACPKRLK